MSICLSCAWWIGSRKTPIKQRKLQIMAEWQCGWRGRVFDLDVVRGLVDLSLPSVGDWWEFVRPSFCQSMPLSGALRRRTATPAPVRLGGPETEGHGCVNVDPMPCLFHLHHTGRPSLFERRCRRTTVNLSAIHHSYLLPKVAFNADVFHHHAPLTVAYLLGDRSFFLMHASRTAYKKYTTLTYLLTYLLACICGCSTCLIMSLSKSRNRKLIYVMPVLFNDQQYTVKCEVKPLGCSGCSGIFFFVIPAHTVRCVRHNRHDNQ